MRSYVYVQKIMHTSNVTYTSSCHGGCPVTKKKTATGITLQLKHDTESTAGAHDGNWQAAT
jgi:hypothetical protein